MIKFFKSKLTEEQDTDSQEPLLSEESLAALKEHIASNPLREFKGAKSKDPLVIQTDRKARFVRLSLQTEVSFHLDTIEIFNKDGRNIAPNKQTIISSTYNNEEKYDGRGFVNGKKNGGCGFHTQRERNPWIIIDLMTIRRQCGADMEKAERLAHKWSKERGMMRLEIACIEVSRSRPMSH